MCFNLNSSSHCFFLDIMQKLSHKWQATSISLHNTNSKDKYNLMPHMSKIMNTNASGIWGNFELRAIITNNGSPFPKSRIVLLKRLMLNAVKFTIVALFIKRTYRLAWKNNESFGSYTFCDAEFATTFCNINNLTKWL